MWIRVLAPDIACVLLAERAGAGEIQARKRLIPRLRLCPSVERPLGDVEHLGEFANSRFRVDAEQIRRAYDGDIRF